jgi:hypothetical protein
MRETDKTVACCVIGAVFVLGCAAEEGVDPGPQAQAPSEELQAPFEEAQPEAPSEEPVPSEEPARPSDEALLPPRCNEHSECASDVCDRDAFLGRGACVPEVRVVYAASAAPGCITGDGSRANPVCSIRTALELAVGDKDTIRVYPGSYLNFSVGGGRSIRVFGPGADQAEVGEEDLGAGVRITSGARVVLDGLTLGGGAQNGINCDASALKVVRSDAIGNLRGMISTDCTFTLDRVRVLGGSRSGLTVAGAGEYRITNSYFRGGDIQGVEFTGSATGTFRFNTVTRSGEINAGGIACGTVSRLIEDSIVAGNFAAEDGAQTVGACMHRRVVVGSGDTRPLPGLITLDPELDEEGRLLDTPANAACCIDRAPRFVLGVHHDFFGTSRPQGRSNDIGAHELCR